MTLWLFALSFLVLVSSPVFSQHDDYQRQYAEYVSKVSRAVAEDALLNVPQLIGKYGYDCESHEVVTVDGYILTMHRILAGRNDIRTANKPVVFLQHGLLSSSADWIITGAQKGLGYILADQGYDVWMGNVRGNKHSRNHTYLKPESAEFWDFSWHQMGVYDLPAMIDYVLANTDQKDLYYVGHSQGNTIFYVMCSQLPEYNAKIRAQFSLAPIAYMSHITSPIMQALSYITGGLETILQLVGINEFLPSNEFMRRFGDRFCGNGITQMLCTNALFAVCGFNKDQLNTTLLPILLGHTPAGASTKQFIHYAQEIRSGYFRQWDYGFVGNMKRYRSFRPPSYDLGKITAPVYLHHGPNDWLSAEKDVMRLYKELGNARAYIRVPDQKFNHLDFMFAIDASKLVYNRVVGLLRGL